MSSHPKEATSWVHSSGNQHSNSDSDARGLRPNVATVRSFCCAKHAYPPGSCQRFLPIPNFRPSEVDSHFRDGPIGTAGSTSPNPLRLRCGPVPCHRPSRCAFSLFIEGERQRLASLPNSRATVRSCLWLEDSAIAKQRWHEQAMTGQVPRFQRDVPASMYTCTLSFISLAQFD